MQSSSNRISSPCPSCSPDRETVHESLKRGGGRVTVRCTECDHVHKIRPESERSVERDVIVSQDGESFHTTVDAPAEERVRVGEEFLLETEDAIMQVRITDIETGPEKRVNVADVSDVSTLWTREVDNVSVNVTIHPRDGTGNATRSVDLHVPGDFEFSVGETVDLEGESITVTDIHVRETAIDRYPFRKLGNSGDTVEAKDVKRVYAYDETTTKPFSAW